MIEKNLNPSKNSFSATWKFWHDTLGFNSMRQIHILLSFWIGCTCSFEQLVFSDMNSYSGNEKKIHWDMTCLPILWNIDSKNEYESFSCQNGSCNETSHSETFNLRLDKIRAFHYVFAWTSIVSGRYFANLGTSFIL